MPSYKTIATVMAVASTAAAYRYEDNLWTRNAEPEAYMEEYDSEPYLNARDSNIWAREAEPEAYMEEYEAESYLNARDSSIWAREAEPEPYMEEYDAEPYLNARDSGLWSREAEPEALMDDDGFEHALDAREPGAILNALGTVVAAPFKGISHVVGEARQGVSNLGKGMATSYSNGRNEAGRSGSVSGQDPNQFASQVGSGTTVSRRDLENYLNARDTEDYLEAREAGLGEFAAGTVGLAAGLVAGTGDRIVDGFRHERQNIVNSFEGTYNGAKGVVDPGRAYQRRSLLDDEELMDALYARWAEEDADPAAEFW